MGAHTPRGVRISQYTPWLAILGPVPFQQRYSSAVGHCSPRPVECGGEPQLNLSGTSKTAIRLTEIAQPVFAAPQIHRSADDVTFRLYIAAFGINRGGGRAPRKLHLRVETGLDRTTS